VPAAGRVDLGFLQCSDRIWTSDCNDPLERQQVQRWTGLMVPPELMGAHVGPSHARRTSDLSFRAGTALFGHFGIEWDLVSAGADALAELEAWITVYKRFRAAAQLPAGARRRRGRRCPGARVVSGSGEEALYACVQLATTTSALPPSVRLPGLTPGGATASGRFRPGRTR
jgi:alpha-galactosidase